MPDDVAFEVPRQSRAYVQLIMYGPIIFYSLFAVTVSIRVSPLYIKLMPHETEQCNEKQQNEAHVELSWKELCS